MEPFEMTDDDWRTLKKRSFQDFTRGSDAGQDQEEQEEDVEERATFSGKRASFSTDSPKPPISKQQQQFGQWEKHTKGIGSKLLQKMGWKPGQGLGTDADRGLVKPIEVKLRPKGVGLGTVEERTEADRQLQQKKKALEQKDAATKAKRDLWKRQETTAAKRVAFKTVEEILAEEMADLREDQRSAVTKVLDMRGPEVKELGPRQKLADIVSPIDLSGAEGYLPELRFNVQLLADRTDQDIHSLGRELRSETVELEKITKQIEITQLKMETERTQLERLQRVLVLMQQMESRAKQLVANQQNDPFVGTDSDSYEDLIKELTEQYYQEFLNQSLGDAIVALIAPMLRRIYTDWNPLEYPSYGVDIFQGWRSLLQSHQKSGKKMSAYESMIAMIWLPKVRSCINNEWNPRQSDPVIHLLETWHPFLPEFIFENILEQLVSPKLHKAILEWNPKTEKQLLHAWLHPWLPLMGHLLEPLYVIVRQKLATSLQDWHPTDPSGFAQVNAWHNVFSKKDMEVFLTRHIIPKLLYMLDNEFKVNPRKQDLEPFHAVLPWRTLIPPPLFIQLLERAFFHKWLHTLYRWLTVPNKTPAFFDEVSKWYTEWKSLFPADLRTQPAIQAQFTVALNMMNQTMSTGIVEGFANGVYASPHPPPTSSTFTSQFSSTQNAPSLSSSLPSTSAPSTITFKETVDYFAQKHNIMFQPTQKTHKSSGKSLYRFGQAWIYLDGTIIYALADPGSVDVTRAPYEPVSFERLLELAQS